MFACFLVMRPITVSELTDFPDPDSPTIPRVSPGWTEYETPSTALTRPSSVGKWTRRSLTSSSGSGTDAPLGVPHARIESCVDDVDDQVRHHDEDCGEDRHPDHRREVRV